jgi:hypothetical protein
MSELKAARFAATKQFSKAMAKLSPKRQAKVKAALDADGDLRILFDALDELNDDGSTVTVGNLITVGTHSQIYG